VQPETEWVREVGGRGRGEVGGEGELGREIEGGRARERGRGRAREGESEGASERDLQRNSD
jgi:hypothetical protein